MRSAGVLVTALLAGCGLMPAFPPDWVANRTPLESCGEEEAGHGESLDVAARTCLLEAFEQGRGAELISTFTSVEGDPIREMTRVHENGTIEKFVDATRDRFGSGAWERFLCETLVPVEEWNAAENDTMPMEYVFIEDGCEPMPVP
jgi:hypothetical protein